MSRNELIEFECFNGTPTLKINGKPICYEGLTEIEIKTSSYGGTAVTLRYLEDYEAWKERSKNK